MKILRLNKHNQKELMQRVIETLKKGGLVIAPSDTVYGLLADATNESAVRKLIQFKARPAGKPISVFLPSFESIKKYTQIDKKQLLTLSHLLPGPFTVILKSRKRTSVLIESEKGTLGIRLPNYPFISELTKKYQLPITATSANLSGRPPNYSIQTMLASLSKDAKSKIDLIIDYGKLPYNKPSTLVDLTEPQVKILRQGDLVFKDTKTFISKFPDLTKKIAQYVLQQTIKNVQSKPLVFILEGEPGVGKTIFVQGIGEILGIKNIISPTFVIYYEYEVKKLKVNPPVGGQKSKLVHIDLYNIQGPEEFEHLRLESYLKTGNILCFEWGEKAATIFELLKKRGKLVYVKMKYINEKKREITFNYQFSMINDQ